MVLKEVVLMLQNDEQLQKAEVEGEGESKPSQFRGEQKGSRKAVHGEKTLSGDGIEDAGVEEVGDISLTILCRFFSKNQFFAALFFSLGRNPIVKRV